jgi:phospholipid/cholesterol/gamma-HCH transport system substrate-binding protein
VATELTESAPQARRAARRRAREIAAGAIALFGLVAVVAWASARGATGTLRGHYLLHAQFDQIDGLVVGSPVQLAGLKIGAVAATTLDRQNLKPGVTLAIREGTRIPVDSAALILSDGVLGGKFVRIDPGADDAYLAPGQRFRHVQDSVIVERLLEKIVRAAEAKRGAR